jgi:hypothetical protein
MIKGQPPSHKDTLVGVKVHDLKQKIWKVGPLAIGDVRK